MFDAEHRTILTKVVFYWSAGSLLVLAGCATPTIRAHGVAPLNVNPVNESTPVDVRFYQLSDDQPFITTPFETLWLEAPKVLGNTLMGPVVVRTVFPGVAGDPPVTLPLTGFAQQTRFIGVLALFRTSDGTPRQLVISCDQLNNQVLELRGSTVWIGEFPLAAKIEPASEPQSSATAGRQR